MSPTVILNIGKVEGVVPEMKFYLSRPGKHFIVLEVTKHSGDTSEASVVLASLRDNGKELEPKVGLEGFESCAQRQLAVYAVAILPRE